MCVCVCVGDMPDYVKILGWVLRYSTIVGYLMQNPLYTYTYIEYLLLKHIL